MCVCVCVCGVCVCVCVRVCVWCVCVCCEFLSVFVAALNFFCIFFNISPKKQKCARSVHIYLPSVLQLVSLNSLRACLRITPVCSVHALCFYGLCIHLPICYTHSLHLSSLSLSLSLSLALFSLSLSSSHTHTDTQVYSAPRTEAEL